MAAWQQELWRRQRAHLAAHEEDATTLFVRAPLTAVAQHHSHGVATTTASNQRQQAKRLRSPRYNSGPASNKLRRSDQDDHISAATKNDNDNSKRKDKKDKKNEKGKEKLHQVVVVDNGDEELVDENEAATAASATRSKKKRSSSFKRAVEKIKHMTASRHEEDEVEEAEEDDSALRPAQTHNSLAATLGVFDLGANQVNALAWYQRLSAAARPQRSS